MATLGWTADRRRSLSRGVLAVVSSPRLQRIAWTWGLAALIVFVVLAFAAGVPEGPEGTLIAGRFQTELQLALLGVTFVGLVLAWRWPLPGAVVVVLAAAAIGVFAAFEYRPLAALVPFVALFIPGLMLLVAGLRSRPPWWWLVSALGIVAIVAGSGVAAQRAYDWSFGPTHPESSLDAPPVDLVEWAWSGALTPTGVRVTARLDDPYPDARLVVDTRPDLAGRGRVFRAVRSADDGEVLAFAVTGLTPETEYFYAVRAAGRMDRTRVGRFRTPAVGPQSFTLAVGGDARRSSNGAVFDAIRASEPLMYLLLGDMFYADIASDDPDRFRSEFDLALTRPAQQALYLSTPVSYVWDDHDYGPDDSDSTSPTRRAAQTVYREVVPHPPLAAGPREGPIHHAFTLGRVRVIVTDSRSARDPADRPDEAGKSMLGGAQLAWLKRELLAARGRFPLTIVATSVPWIAEAAEGADSWAGYSTERREISRFIADNAITGVVLLAGDAHMIAFDDGRNADYTGTGRARVPVFHAAALDRRGEVRGGPYSGGAHPGSGQFGTLTVRDDGERVVLALRGLDWTGREIIRRQLVLPAP